MFVLPLATYTHIASLYGATCSGLTATPAHELARHTLKLVHIAVRGRLVRRHISLAFAMQDRLRQCIRLTWNRFPFVRGTDV